MAGNLLPHALVEQLEPRQLLSASPHVVRIFDPTKAGDMRMVHCACTWVLMWGGFWGVARAADPATRPVANLTNAELIDRLTEVTNREFSVRTNIFRVGPATTMPRGTLMLQQAGPTPSEVMIELAGRGAASLPDLADHLDDGRKTGATIGALAGGIRYSAEYDWKPGGGRAQPKGTVDARGRGFRPRSVDIIGTPDRREYVVTVGDLCFNLIGQIVNRRFLAVRYQPSALLVVNSPLLCPDLREAVRNEWGQVTRAQLLASLLDDLDHPSNRAQADGAAEILGRLFPNLH